MPGLTENALRELREAIWRVDRLWSERSAQPDSKRGVVPRVRVAKTDGSGITAASGATPGSGTCTIQERDSSGDLAAVASTDTVTVYNFVAEAAAASAYVFICQDHKGDFWLVAEAC